MTLPIVRHVPPSCDHQLTICLAITHLLNETSSLFSGEIKAKQQSIDSLHATLRTTSAELGDARRTLEAMQEKVKAQELTRQKVINFSRAREEEEYRMHQLEQAHGRLDVNKAVAWETELDSALESVSSSSVTGEAREASLSSVAKLRARINAIRSRSNETRRAVSSLQSRSREVELKYRHLVALCTRRPAAEVDVLLDGLTRAVESEKGDLEIGRVRRFLGGVEGVVH